MALVNGNFETAGAQRYEAAGWVRTKTGDGWLFAPFVGDTALQDVTARENFDAGYGYKLFAFKGFFVDLDQAYFNAAVNAPTPAESFETRWGATGAKIKANLSAPYAFEPGMTLLLSVLDGPTQTITFAARHFVNIHRATQGEVVNAINDQLEGARAYVDGRWPAIITGMTGPGAHLRVVGGTAVPLLFSVPPSEAQGQPEAGAFYREIEFTYLDVDAFDSGYGPRQLGTDVGDSSGRLVALQAPDTFVWRGAITSGLVLADLSAEEHFYDWASDQANVMQTYFGSV
jgi:hypothetical protein